MAEVSAQRYIRQFPLSWSAAAVVILGPVLHLGCASPTKPSSGPVISCPNAETEETLNGSPVMVSFPDPLVSGGQSPVTTTCSPPSGSSFAVGTTVVTCTSRDATGQAASCNFPITVSNVPQITATKYVAFGDDITEGEIDSTCAGAGTLGPGSPTTAGRGEGWSRRDWNIVDPSRSYPTKLLAALSGHYPVQNFSVINAGLSGETAEQGSTRLPAVLSAQQPHVLLLQEGANDLRKIGSGTPPQTATLTVVNSLRAMIRGGRQRGVTVFVATLLPQRPGACRAYSPEYIEAANDMIRVMVDREGAGVALVDLYAAFGGVAGTLVGADGLHPNAAGYQQIADTFFASLQSRLEKTNKLRVPLIGEGGPPTVRTRRVN
jgi:lysophospholipase L1-like esterase